MVLSLGTHTEARKTPLMMMYDVMTHVIIIDEFVKFVPASSSAFQFHSNIAKVLCHQKVEKIEQNAFRNCPSLRETE